MEQPRNLTFRRGLLLLLILQSLQTLYATWLNALFYRRFPPFFDSMEYTLLYARFLATARASGIPAALQASFHAGTVSLPWIWTSLLSPVLSFSRYPAIWFQELWMAALIASIFYYLVRCRRLAPWTAFCFSLPFVFFRQIFAANGGVSDFRMDLLLYLLLSLMTVWYLAARETGSSMHWALSGLFLLLAVLNRATAPVYMTAMFVPVLLERALRRDRRTLAHVALAWGPPTLLACAALAANYPTLYHYYFQTSGDPNSHLPLWKSAAHILLAGWAIGIPLTVVCVPALYLGLRAGKLARADWQVLWLGTAPVLLLWLRGAGLNPFVSMPAVFGWLLFCLLPFPGQGSPLSPRAQRRLAGCLLAACALNAVNGLWIHLHPPGIGPAMPAIRTAIDRMRADTIERGRHTAAFATAHILDVQALAIRNVLVFDYGARLDGDACSLAGIVFRAPHYGFFNVPDPLIWQNEIPGRSDDEKFNWLVTVANRDVDYFLLPDEATIAWLESHHPDRFINSKVREFRRRLLATGRWQPLGPPLVASPRETVTLYRKS